MKENTNSLLTLMNSEICELEKHTRMMITEIIKLYPYRSKIEQESLEKLAKLALDIREASEQVQETHTSCKEQISGIEQINRDIQQLNHLVQQKRAYLMKKYPLHQKKIDSQLEMFNNRADFYRVANYDEMENNDIVIGRN